MNTLIAFATYLEAACTIKQMAATQIDEHLFEAKPYRIVITGMGPDVTERTLQRHIHDADLILNFGITGALREGFTVGALHEIKEVSDGATTIYLQDTGMKLYTMASPLHDPELRDHLGKSHDFVDMEGHAIAKVAKQHKKGCRLYKMVSDFCTKTTSAEIRARLPLLSELLFYELSTQINRDAAKAAATGTLTY